MILVDYDPLNRKLSQVYSSWNFVFISFFICIKLIDFLNIYYERDRHNILVDIYIFLRLPSFFIGQQRNSLSFVTNTIVYRLVSIYMLFEPLISLINERTS